MKTLRDLGEFGLIERIKKSIRTDSSVVKGIGDDCAVLKLNAKSYALATSDMLVEGVDFTPKDDAYLVGRKAIAVSISDIAACAGIPRYCLVSLGLPAATRVGFTERLFAGMRAIAKIYDINIVGGDLSRARQLVIDVTMFGVVEKKRLLLRSGARYRDIIFVSGSLGGSIAGKHLKFSPRLKEAGFLARNFKLNSMIDISDGLAQDLTCILRESRVGAVIYEELIPLAKSAAGLSDALYSGEDFELLFTLPLEEARRLIRKKMKFIRPIGEIRARSYGLRLIDKNNREKILEPRGFRHF
ncbi:MAG: thiamine-phosphate kinase [Candidatus Omnitrophota bacterium]|nr:thiamine-phosphate kinase [Candidatus Omnitrophota bacterium]